MTPSGFDNNELYGPIRLNTFGSSLTSAIWEVFGSQWTDIVFPNEYVYIYMYTFFLNIFLRTSLASWHLTGSKLKLWKFWCECDDISGLLHFSHPWLRGWLFRGVEAWKNIGNLGKGVTSSIDIFFFGIQIETTFNAIQFWQTSCCVQLLFQMGHVCSTAFFKTAWMECLWKSQPTSTAVCCCCCCCCCC